MFTVIIKKSVLKNTVRMPIREQELLTLLIDDLKVKGPMRKEWPNFSRLEKNRFHCHLSHHRVACWEWEDDSIIIEVYYAGSRENAPY